MRADGWVGAGASIMSGAAVALSAFVSKITAPRATSSVVEEA